MTASSSAVRGRVSRGRDTQEHLGARPRRLGALSALGFALGLFTLLHAVGGDSQQNQQQKATALAEGVPAIVEKCSESFSVVELPHARNTLTGTMYCGNIPWTIRLNLGDADGWVGVQLALVQPGHFPVNFFVDASWKFGIRFVEGNSPPASHEITQPMDTWSRNKAVWRLKQWVHKATLLDSLATKSNSIWITLDITIHATQGLAAACSTDWTVPAFPLLPSEPHTRDEQFDCGDYVWQLHVSPAASRTIYPASPAHSGDDTDAGDGVERDAFVAHRHLSAESSPFLAVGISLVSPDPQLFVGLGVEARVDVHIVNQQGLHQSDRPSLLRVFDKSQPSNHLSIIRLEDLYRHGYIGSTSSPLGQLSVSLNLLVFEERRTRPLVLPAASLAAPPTSERCMVAKQVPGFVPMLNALRRFRAGEDQWGPTHNSLAETVFCGSVEWEVELVPLSMYEESVEFVDFIIRVHKSSISILDDDWAMLVRGWFTLSRAGSPFTPFEVQWRDTVLTRSESEIRLRFAIPISKLLDPRQGFIYEDGSVYFASHITIDREVPERLRPSKITAEERCAKDSRDDDAAAPGGLRGAASGSSLDADGDSFAPFAPGGDSASAPGAAGAADDADRAPRRRDVEHPSVHLGDPGASDSSKSTPSDPYAVGLDDDTLDPPIDDVAAPAAPSLPSWSPRALHDPTRSRGLFSSIFPYSMVPYLWIVIAFGVVRFALGTVMEFKDAVVEYSHPRDTPLAFGGSPDPAGLPHGAVGVFGAALKLAAASSAPSAAPVVAEAEAEIAGATMLQTPPTASPGSVNAQTAAASITAAPRQKRTHEQQPQTKRALLKRRAVSSASSSSSSDSTASSTRGTRASGSRAARREAAATERRKQQQQPTVDAQSDSIKSKVPAKEDQATPARASVASLVTEPAVASSASARRQLQKEKSRQNRKPRVHQNPRRTTTAALAAAPSSSACKRSLLQASSSPFSSDSSSSGPSSPTLSAKRRRRLARSPSSASGRSHSPASSVATGSSSSCDPLPASSSSATDESDAGPVSAGRRALALTQATATSGVPTSSVPVPSVSTASSSSAAAASAAPSSQTVVVEEEDDDDEELLKTRKRRRRRRRDKAAVAAAVDSGERDAASSSSGKTAARSKAKAKARNQDAATTTSPAIVKSASHSAQLAASAKKSELNTKAAPFRPKNRRPTAGGAPSGTADAAAPQPGASSAGAAGPAAGVSEGASVNVWGMLPTSQCHVLTPPLAAEPSWDVVPEAANPGRQEFTPLTGPALAPMLLASNTAAGVTSTQHSPLLTPLTPSAPHICAAPTALVSASTVGCDEDPCTIGRTGECEGEEDPVLVPQRPRHLSGVSQLRAGLPQDFSLGGGSRGPESPGSAAAWDPASPRFRKYEAFGSNGYSLYGAAGGSQSNPAAPGPLGAIGERRQLAPGPSAAPAPAQEFTLFGGTDPSPFAWRGPDPHQGFDFLSAASPAMPAASLLSAANAAAAAGGGSRPLLDAISPDDEELRSI